MSSKSENPLSDKNEEIADVTSFPERSQLFINEPLYKPFFIKLENEKADALYIRELEADDIKVDLYCGECKQLSTFESDRHYFANSHRVELWGTGGFPTLYGKRKYIDENLERVLANRSFSVNLRCVRNDEHKAVFVFIVNNKTLQKIGQYPTLADQQLQEVEKYKKLLSKKHIEFKKAIGLYAHGIGIGAIVYLRRIIEDFIIKAHEQAKQDTSWNEDEYQRSRAIEKISILEPFLPSYLVETKQIYGVLSKGIHELDEEECKNIFPLMKGIIELTLDEQLAETERQRKKQEMKTALGNLTNNLKPKKD